MSNQTPRGYQVLRDVVDIWGFVIDRSSYIGYFERREITPDEELYITFLLDKYDLQRDPKSPDAISNQRIRVRVIPKEAKA